MNIRASVHATPAGHRADVPLSALGQFDGDAPAFWPAYVEAVAAAFGARRVLLLTVRGDRPWEAQVQWPVLADAAQDARRVLRLAGAALDESPWLDAASRDEGAGDALSVALPVGPVVRAEATVLVVLLPREASSQAGVLLALADLAAAVPVQYLRRQGSPAAAVAVGQPLLTERAEQLYDILQLSIRLNGESRYMGAALTLCNDLATRFGCERVSLGRVEGSYVKVRAISHVEKFDERASATRELEIAMEEAQEQQDEVAWPAPPDTRVLSRAHETYARTQGCGHLLSVPVQVDDAVVAVIVLERRRAALAPEEVWALRLIAQACARQLAELGASDRWIGARLLGRLGQWRDTLLSPRLTAWKLGALGLIAALAAVTFTPWPYRVDSPLTLRSKDMLFMPAPFDGYLRRVNVEIGDSVAAGAVLLELDTRELALEESMAASDEARYSRDAEKAQALHQLADMQIMLARQRQSASKLELIRHQLASAQIRAPNDGVVVEGELKKNLGAPVRKGDLLIKLAQNTDTYLELEIDQVDIHEVRAGTQGEFAFVGRPDLRFALVIERVDPVATVRERRNVFLAHARVSAPTQAWWRPGMGGSARLEAGERSVLWILTHRTIRFLQQAFWL